MGEKKKKKKWEIHGKAEKKRKKLIMPSMAPHIPMEIVADILSRLPVKSLLRFKSVCKQWQSLISDPKFNLSKGRERALVYFSPPHHSHRESNTTFWSLDENLFLDQVSNPLKHVLPSPDHRIEFLVLSMD